MNKWSQLFKSALLGGVILATSAWADNPTVIRIGIPGTGIGGRPIVGGTGGAYALTQTLLENEFKKDNVKIEVAYFVNAGPAINEAFANHLLDFAYLGDQAAVVGKAGGLDYKIVAAGARTSDVGLAIAQGSPIKSIEDLRGKRVGIFRGTALQLSADRILAAHGLSEKDLNVVSLNTIAGQSALASKDLDAYFTTLDGALTFQDQGIAKVIYSTKNDPKARAQIFGVYVASDAWAKRYPQTVERILRVFARADAYVGEEKNRIDTYKVWAKSGVPFAVYNRLFQGVNLKAYNSPILDPWFVSEINRAVVDLKGLRLIRHDIDVNSWVDYSYLSRALADEKLENYWK